MRKILVTGALGQIGAELVPALRARYGAAQVVASDLRMRPGAPEVKAGAFEHLDCTDIPAIHNLVQRHDIGAIYHLASILSAVAEEKPQAAWSLNMGGLYGILEAAREHRCQVFARPHRSAPSARRRRRKIRPRSPSRARPPSMG